MHHFFTDPQNIYEQKIVIKGSDVNHMKNVLRIKPGEHVQICDGNGMEYQCSVEHYEADEAILNILNCFQSNSELSSEIYLFQGLPKGDKMELIIQKAAELGVYKVIPVATKRAVVKLDQKKAVKKVERWNAISESAAKQSGRSIIPVVEHVMNFSEALQYAKEMDLILFPYELAKGMYETKEIISTIQPNQKIGVFIGPEGGFEEEEVVQAEKMGAYPITLGKRILRTETAGLTVLAILMYQLEN